MVDDKSEPDLEKVKQDQESEEDATRKEIDEMVDELGADDDETMTEDDDLDDDEDDDSDDDAEEGID